MVLQVRKQTLRVVFGLGCSGSCMESGVIRCRNRRVISEVRYWRQALRLMCASLEADPEIPFVRCDARGYRARTQLTNGCPPSPSTCRQALLAVGPCTLSLLPGFYSYFTNAANSILFHRQESCILSPLIGTVSLVLHFLHTNRQASSVSRV